ncbi:unnamed protein product [Schistocephalus solidus]|uniref:Uncharacterized protein n=1 Tax=Schistocephalus solidus TaxID=70667 RepID=A0A183SJB6_SCHSO|nr:unnamed protein product [Schistocephalus solidus]
MRRQPIDMRRCTEHASSPQARVRSKFEKLRRCTEHASSPQARVRPKFEKFPPGVFQREKRPINASHVAGQKVPERSPSRLVGMFENPEN